MGSQVVSKTRNRRGRGVTREQLRLAAFGALLVSRADNPTLLLIEAQPGFPGFLGKLQSAMVAQLADLSTDKGFESALLDGDAKAAVRHLPPLDKYLSRRDLARFHAMCARYGRRAAQDKAILTFASRAEDPFTAVLSEGFLAPETVQALREQNGYIFAKLDQTTSKQLREWLSKQFEAGTSPFEIADGLHDHWANVTRARAEHITRTEMAWAANRSEYDSYRELGATSTTWHTARGDRVCPICRPLDGKTVSLNNQFEAHAVEGWDAAMAKGFDQQLHPPLHVSCRCFLTPEFGPKVQEKTAPPSISGARAFKTKTDVPFFDDMLAKPKYFEDAKELTFQIQKMEPDEYLKHAAEGMDVTTEKLVETRDPKAWKAYAQRMRAGDQFPMPYLSYEKQGFSQEGVRRALAAREAGVHDMPVMVVWDMNGPKPVFLQTVEEFVQTLAGKKELVLPPGPSASWRAKVFSWAKSRIRNEIPGEKITQNDLVIALEKAAKRQLTEGRVCTRVYGNDLVNILKDGRFMSQFETGTSGGWIDEGHKTRQYFEKQFFGYPKNLPDEKRPIYGFVSRMFDDPTHPTAQLTSQHGEALVVFKDSVRRRTTVCLGDSLDANNAGKWAHSVPSPITNPSWLSTMGFDVRHTDVDTVGRKAFLQPLYWEAQIHGGLPTSDVDEIVFFWTGNDRRYEGGKIPGRWAKELARHGIKWRVVDAR